MPSRLLYSTNIAKGESRSKRETKFHELIMPSRILYSTNVLKFYHSQCTGMNKQSSNRAY